MAKARRNHGRNSSFVSASSTLILSFLLAHTVLSLVAASVALVPKPRHSSFRRVSSKGRPYSSGPNTLPQPDFA
jgi:hypothetical protein